MNHSILFPTFIVHSDNPNMVNSELTDNIKQLIFAHRDKPFVGNCISTVKTKNNVLDDPCLAEVKKTVINTVFHYCEKLHIDIENLVIKSSWANYYDTNGYQDLHNHNNSVLSGIFYLQSDESRDLIFQAPWHFFQPVSPKCKKYGLENCHNVDFESKVGRCYVFASHLLHQTLPAKSERISIAFNVNYMD